MSIVTFMKELIRYKFLLNELIIRDLKVKYKRSVLGYFWSLLNPLLMMTVLTIVFSKMFRFNIPNYPAYLLAGQLLFGFYSEATSMAMGSILAGGSLIKKVRLPKFIFPVSRVFSCFTTMTFSLMALFIVMLCTGVYFGPMLLLCPLILFYVLFFTIGVGLILSAYAVQYRDIEHLYGVFVTAFNYLTPIFYPVEMLPEWLLKLMPLNPMYCYITFFRKITVWGQWPSIEDHLACVAFSVVSVLIGLYAFSKKQDDFILYI